MPTRATPLLPKSPPANTDGLGGFRRLNGLRARVAAGAGALLLGQGITILVQLLSLPLYLSYWDASRYGQWLMLSAIPVYFAMSDGGMLPVAANRINMLVAGGEGEQANAVFQSALALVLAALFSIATVGALVLLSLGNAVLDADSRLALWLLLLMTLSGFFGGLFDAAFRAYGAYASGVMYANGLRLAEFAGLAAGLTILPSFTGAAAGALLGRFLGSLLLMQYCRRRFPALQWRLARASLAELRALLRPALSYLAFPLGNSLAIQALTLLVGTLFGTVVVATFNTYRTLSRLVLQVVSTLGHAVWAEFSRLYGAGEAGQLRSVYRRAMRLGTAASIAATLVMVPAAPYLLQVWTHGRIGFELEPFLLFALATLFGGIASVPRVLLMSTNLHTRLGVVYVFTSSASVMAAWLLGRAWGVNGAVLAFTASEAVLLAASARMAGGALESMPRTSAVVPA
jgi:O-antigen/teichoic acid export membrane protein